MSGNRQVMFVDDEDGVRTSWQRYFRDRGPWIPLSLNPYTTRLEFLKLIPAAMFFYVLLYTVNSRRQILFLVGVILAVALFEVAYGLWHLQDRLIWGWKNPHASNRLCGTFESTAPISQLT